MKTAPTETLSEDNTPGKSIDWEAKLRENESWLRTVIALRVGEAAAVEEVWQEVSLAAVAQRSPLHNPERVSSWMYQLAVRQSLLYRRKMGRRRKLVNRYVEKVVPNHVNRAEQNPLDLLLAEERHQQVRDAMKRLEELDQEMLLLKYVHNWSYREMAEKLGLTVSAIQARLHRARQRLRDELNF